MREQNAYSVRMPKQTQLARAYSKMHMTCQPLARAEASWRALCVARNPVGNHKPDRERRRPARLRPATSAKTGTVAGTTLQVADDLGEVFEATGSRSGFMLGHAVSAPGDLAAIVELPVPNCSCMVGSAASTRGAHCARIPSNAPLRSSRRSTGTRPGR
jgi:alkanesulfonate monooxygenase SsuD/methylene tetrahydromethanopterin reductase-like flavin-dependent oxidoreductase (luciferase family)